MKGNKFNGQLLESSEQRAKVAEKLLCGFSLIRLFLLWFWRAFVLVFFFVLPAAPLVFCLVRVVKNEKFAAFTSNFFPCSTFFIIFINSISQEWLLLLSAALFGAHQCCCYVSLDHTIEHTKKKFSSLSLHSMIFFPLFSCASLWDVRCSWCQQT